MSIGVLMIVIKDKSIYKPGKKVNSLKETFSLQGQTNMYKFAKIIQVFKSPSV